MALICAQIEGSCRSFRELPVQALHAILAGLLAAWRDDICQTEHMTSDLSCRSQLSAQTLRGGMAEFAVGAGMQVTAEIVEGRRMVMEYLLLPVKRVVSEAGRER